MRKGLAQDQAGVWWYHSGGRRARAQLLNCDTCGQEFPTHPSGRPRYCSIECRRRNCSVCGTAFAPSGNRKAYCSDRCKYGEANCETCGEVFVPGRGDRKRFCSVRCSYLTGKAVGLRRLTVEGYAQVKVPQGTPGAVYQGKYSAGWMLEHRYVMQQMVGRALEPHEKVHHRNGIRDDNRSENLELWREKQQPSGVRSLDYHCPGCTCS